ncbi:MAG: hypothetical protein IT282_06675 [Bacteroidetes bacterium]|nr:hypothetical protein [Bacteroidota bacterium]
MKTSVRTCLLWLAAAVVGLLPGTASAGMPDEKTERELRAVKEYVKASAAENAVAPATSPDQMKPDLRSPAKTSGIAAQRDRKSVFINGNKIATQIYNYGGISPGYDALRGVNNLVWHNLDYVFQFCPIVGASVPSAWEPSRRLHIISDGLWDYPALREVNPTGDTLWQWQPLPGYADPDQPDMASNPADDDDGDGKPDSWPRAWYNPSTGKYVWPGYLSQDILSADLEVFWAMDDRFNMEFPYYPFPMDSTRKGIGLQVDGRVFQWSNALAENTIFFVYTITNISEKDLDTLFFGVYGDADLGGGSPENTDDNGFFIPPYDTLGRVDDIPVYSRSLVYFWDPDMKGARGLPLGYVGCKFLESPGHPNNLLDDDGDGVIDERQDDGIDNDGDWSPLSDDIGVDGVPNTEDEGEGNGVPDAGKKLPDGSLDPLYPGEPNYELTDLDESDQIGLTSFNSWTWNTDRISNDESMWNRSIPRNFGSIQQSADIVFIFGSGYISLAKGETKRISTSLLLAEDLDGLLVTARTVQTIYNKNYQFFRPPITPSMTAVPGDKKVTLYWDTAAEASVDPITGNDFEGYVIYRSTDPSFNDIQTVTDGKGSSFLTEPLQEVGGREAKWDVAVRQEKYTDTNQNGKYDTGEPFVDINKDGRWSAEVEDPWKGYHPVPYQDRGIQYYLGNNRGLVHSFVDSNNVINGQTYYYAVVAYDHGDSVGISPTETTKKISEDPITSVLKFDANTAQVIPGPRTNGYVPPAILSKDITHDQGIATGPVTFRIMNDLAVRSGGQYQISFADSFQNGNRKEGGKNYSVLDLLPVKDTFVPFDTNYSALSREGIADDSFLKVTDASGTVYTKDVDYVVNFQRGSIRRTAASAMSVSGTYTVQYRYYPVYQSRALRGEDSNPAFDGIELRIEDHPTLAYDSIRSRWVEGTTNCDFIAKLTSIGTRKRLWPADYEIRFSSQNIDTALVQSGGLIRVPVRYSVHDVTTGTPQRIQTFLAENTATRDQQWSPGEELVLFKPGATGLPTDTTTWGVVITRTGDSSQTPRLPTDGDVLLIATRRPFYAEDQYTLRTEAARVDDVIAASAMDRIIVVPNPYVGLSEIEPTNRLPGATRGERRIYFEHLPSRCSIRIFTINGDLVQIIEHDAGMDNGREFWNLLNRDGFSVAYGVYVAHIDAPGIGERILKFALIK